MDAKVNLGMTSRSEWWFGDFRSLMADASMATFALTPARRAERKDPADLKAVGPICCPMCAARDRPILAGAVATLGTSDEALDGKRAAALHNFYPAPSGRQPDYRQTDTRMEAPSPVGGGWRECGADLPLRATPNWRATMSASWRHRPRPARCNAASTIPMASPISFL